MKSLMAPPLNYALHGVKVMQLPDQMPDGCNFFGLLQTELSLGAVAEPFAAAGWCVTPLARQQRLDIGWGRLSLADGSPMVLQGWIDRPDERASEVLGGLELTSVSQWVNASGRLWREMPFDESMLGLDDPRLPADIKESIRANSAEENGSPARDHPALDTLPRIGVTG
jgi:hypothetical protein